MGPTVVASNVGKKYHRPHADRPGTIQEAMARGSRGWRRLRSADEFWSLSGVSFTVGAGRSVGILGANGSGKSTLLRLIGGVGKPDTGRIEVNGRIGGLLDLAAGFHHDLSGRENVMLAGILNGLSRQEVLERMDEIVEFAEVDDAIDSPVRTYSSGMQMRLAFSVTVHTDPDILLIDEVLAVGDMAFKEKCLDRIAKFKADGCSMLLVSHVGSTVEEMCDEAIWLDGGRLMDHGPVERVVELYKAHTEANPSRLRALRTRPTDPVERIGARLFVTSGGMGTTYLATRLRAAGVPLADKTFVNAFHNQHWPEALCKLAPERPRVATLSKPPTKALVASFARAQEKSHVHFPQRFELHPTWSLEHNMAAYLEFLQKAGAACVLRASDVEGLLSRWGARGAIFMIRKPAEAFVAYAQPNRHADMIDTLGGLDSEDAAEWFASSWRAVAGEYLACKNAGLNPVLIRYERARDDAAAHGDPLIENVFQDFRPSPQPAVPLSVRKRLEALAGPALDEIYP